jgi:hypothetical protein
MRLVYRMNMTRNAIYFKNLISPFAKAQGCMHNPLYSCKSCIEAFFGMLTDNYNAKNSSNI